MLDILFSLSHVSPPPPPPPNAGKLQTLDTLLQQLKVEGHRVLIFTQMARMLDVLEIFLNYHGHTYLRLDGSTPPLKRQVWNRNRGMTVLERASLFPHSF